MSMTKRLIGAFAIAFTALAAGTFAASADVARNDAGPNVGSIGTMVALNPQPLPPRCLPPGCKGAGGNGPGKFRSLKHKV
jgi:hypothetical protein